MYVSDPMQCAETFTGRRRSDLEYARVQTCPYRRRHIKMKIEIYALAYAGNCGCYNFAGEGDTLQPSSPASLTLAAARVGFTRPEQLIILELQRVIAGLGNVLPTLSSAPVIQIPVLFTVANSDM